MEQIVDQLSELKKQLLLKKLYNSEEIGDSGFISNGQIIPIDEQSALELEESLLPDSEKYRRNLDKSTYDAASTFQSYIKKMNKYGISDDYKKPMIQDLYDAKNNKEKMQIIRQYQELSNQRFKQIDPNYGKI